jgi:Leucine-rich repeat (LRR) protein
MNLENLEILDLKANKIQDLPSMIMPKIKKICLDENQLKVIPKFIGQMTSLTELSIGKNKLTEIEDDALSGLTNLVTLDLHLNAFTTFS